MYKHGKRIGNSASFVVLIFIGRFLNVIGANRVLDTLDTLHKVRRYIWNPIEIQGTAVPHFSCTVFFDVV